MRLDERKEYRFLSLGKKEHALGLYKDERNDYRTNTDCDVASKFGIVRVYKDERKKNTNHSQNRPKCSWQSGNRDAAPEVHPRPVAHRRPLN